MLKRKLKYLFCHSPALISQYLDTVLSHHIWPYFHFYGKCCIHFSNSPLILHLWFFFSSFLLAPPDLCLSHALSWLLAFSLGL